MLIVCDCFVQDGKSWKLVMWPIFLWNLSTMNATPFLLFPYFRIFLLVFFFFSMIFSNNLRIYFLYKHVLRERPFCKFFSKRVQNVFQVKFYQIRVGCDGFSPRRKEKNTCVVLKGFWLLFLHFFSLFISNMTCAILIYGKES